MDKKPEKDRKRLKELSRKWLKQDLTPEEEMEFNTWYDGFSDARVRDYSEQELEAIGQQLYGKIREKNQGALSAGRSRRHWYWIAALLVIGFFIAGWLYLNKEVSINPAQPMAFSEVHAGSPQAVLEVEGGKALKLSEYDQGEVYQGDGVAVEKLESGALVYHAREYASGEKPRQNVLHTPAGGTYKVTLSDGSSVWLNAASRLSFPESFIGDTREVTLEGEAFFQVAHDASKPFIVRAANREIRVLGTEFNVLAYADEPEWQTTLVSGKVELKHEGKRYTLRPGQQARSRGEDLVLRRVNTPVYTAWKDDVFMFDQVDLQTILRRFSRWYDIDIRYEVQRKNDRFVGSIPRTANLEDALEILEAGGIKFRLERPSGDTRPVLVVEK